MTRETNPPTLTVSGLRRTFETSDGPIEVLADISLEVKPHEFVALLGPSGAGKTTLLRCLCGLDTPSGGIRLFEGSPIVDPPDAMGVVFQDYTRSLMPWLTVARNVELPLVKRVRDKAHRRAMASDALAQVGIAGFERKYPWQLSGGMQQRVAIARALAYEPHLLVMDEPFAAVDAQTRSELQDLIRKVHGDRKPAIVFVTHDIDEAVYLADRIVVLTRRPAMVKEDIVVELPEPRDQIRTKADPRYLELREHVLQLIKTA